MKRPFKGSKFWEAVAGLVGVALVIVWLSGGFSPRVAPGSVALAGASVPTDAPRATVEMIETPEIEWTSGTVTSARETTVAARILARIAEIRVRAGDVVRRGDVLVVFESKDIEARVAQARDALNTAKARLALATAEKERFTPLYESGVIPRQRYDEVIAKGAGIDKEFSL
ncbi:MAG: efflux RND transporter periplasmic adaptor subunit [Rhodothalassiaceae bacterium]